MRWAAAILNLALLGVTCGCHPQFHVNLTYRAAERTWSADLGEPEESAAPHGPAQDVQTDLESLLEALDR